MLSFLLLSFGNGLFLQNSPAELYFVRISDRSWDSAVGIATGNGLGDRGFAVRVLVVASALQVVQTSSGTHSAFYLMGTASSFPEREADHSPPTTAEVKKTWIYPSTPLYIFMV
jgi:hypothetical protein